MASTMAPAVTDSAEASDVDGVGVLVVAAGVVVGVLAAVLLPEVAFVALGAFVVVVAGATVVAVGAFVAVVVGATVVEVGALVVVVLLLAVGVAVLLLDVVKAGQTAAAGFRISLFRCLS